MSDAAPNPELLRSLGRLVRGLSALFWGLPLALVVYVAIKTEWIHGSGLLPIALSLTSTGLLLYGVWQLGYFQKQERPWRNTLDRAALLALINFGLSPFLYWWNRLPEQLFFGCMAGGLGFSAL